MWQNKNALAVNRIESNRESQIENRESNSNLANWRWVCLRLLRELQFRVIDGG